MVLYPENDDKKSQTTVSDTSLNLNPYVLLQHDEMCLIMLVHSSKPGTGFFIPHLNLSESSAQCSLTGILSEAAPAIWNINELILHCTASQSDAKTWLFAINHFL